MSLPLIEYARRGQRLDDVPVFDCHAHVHSMASMDSPPIEQQVAEMDRLGINLAAISSTLAINADISRGNDLAAETAERFPGRFVCYCHVSANYADAMLPELERCFVRDCFRGIKLYQVGAPYDSVLFNPVYEFATAHGLPVLAHTWGTQLTGLDRAAQRFPEVAFMAGHAGSDFAYDTYLKAARLAPNLYLDLTYSREHTNMIEHFAAELGPERLVWGSDVPCFAMAHQLGKILFARLPDDAKRRIVYDNAARLFRLPEPTDG